MSAAHRAARPGLLKRARFALLVMGATVLFWIAFLGFAYGVATLVLWIASLFGVHHH